MDQELNAGESQAEDVLFSDGERSLTAQDLRDMRDGDFADRHHEEIVLLIDAIRALEAERLRLSALVSQKFENTKLIDVNLSGADFSIALADGPIPYLIEYLAQMLGHRQLETPLNYSALDLSHREFGPMVLTLQRKNGKSPHVVAAEHLEQLRSIEVQLVAERTSGDGALKDLQAYLSAIPGKEAS